MGVREALKEALNIARIAEYTGNIDRSNVARRFIREYFSSRNSNIILLV